MTCIYIYIWKMFLAQAHELSHGGKTICTVYSKSWTWQMCFGSRVCFLRFDGVFCSKLTCIQRTMQYPIVMANNIIASQYKILLILAVQLYRTSNTWSLLSTVCLDNSEPKHVDHATSDTRRGVTCLWMMERVSSRDLGTTWQPNLNQ